jgi:hypothetical protein
VTRRARLYALAVLPLAALACASSGPMFGGYAPIPKGKGRLYVYQPQGGLGSSGELVWLGGHELANLGAGSYVTVAIAPGRYTFTFEGGVRHPDVDRRIHITAGDAVYCGCLPDQEHDKTRYFCTDDKEDHDYDLRRCRLVEATADPAWER